jgi:hypothetical protein
MYLSRWASSFQLAAILFLGPLSNGANVSDQPEALVRGLYTEVLASHPIGIPGNADLKILTPYLSKTLVHRIDVAITCAGDYDRQFPDPN